jgi:ribosomal protein S18 acetylase RimI-like enzyme
MAELAEPLRPARILDTSKKHKELRGFSCGRKGRVWEDAVNGWVGRVCRAETTEPQLVLMLEDANGQVVGLSSVKPRALQPLLYVKPLLDLPYIHMIGTDHRHHGKRLKDESSPGDALLTATLEHIREASGGGLLPHVWAFVHPKNDASHKLFERHRFGELSPAGKGDAIRVRAPG